MSTIPSTTGAIIALDVGDKRVGVARASLIARLPEPLTTLQRGNIFFNELGNLITAEKIEALVVGWPRGLNGQETDQTRATETFVADLKAHINLPVYFQDEALTSKKARHELETTKKDYRQADIDALAATYILEDFLNSNPSELRQ